MQSSHKATSVKRAQRTLLCAYSSIDFFPHFSPKIDNSKIFPKLSVAHEKKEEIFLGGIVGRGGVMGEKSHHSSHLPQFLPCIWWFLISVAGVGPISHQGKENGCRGPAQVPQVQGGPGSPHPAWTAGQDTHSKCHLWRTWLNVSANNELGGIKATVLSKDNLNKFLSCQTT